MISLYLTSSHVGEYRGSEPLTYQGFNPKNGLVEHLRQDWKEGKCLMVTSDPNSHERNEYFREELETIIRDTFLPCSYVHLCDGRNEEIVNDLSIYDFIFLCGGHVPTQNAFFHKIGLKEKLKNFDGIVMGVSAGSMNCASLVYAQPEEEGETGEWYQRWIEGLGLTDINVLPHYQAVKDDVLDGKRVFEEITYPDSYKKKFYAIPDGSFILVKGEERQLFGEGYLIENGTIRKI